MSEIIINNSGKTDEEILREINDAKVVCQLEGHQRNYGSEMQYRGMVAYEQARLKVAQAAFYDNPSTDNYIQLEKHMILYQNIVCNCSWDRGDDE
tara:strand:- start:7494 stop:7778 length:285 start_codon:yes stop_codon:yes gene_type:complete